MKRKFWTSDKVVSFVAIVVSVFSLFIFVRQTNIIEEQSKRSVMPYLLMDSANNSEKGTYSISIVNYGVGPAIVESRQIRYKDKVYDMEFFDFLKEQIPEMDSVHFINTTTLQVGVAIPSSSERNILMVGGDAHSYTTFLKVLQGLLEDEFYYEITYKSIYGERWSISSNEQIPIHLDD